MQTSNRPIQEPKSPSARTVRMLPFVGREEELERVADFFRAVTAADRLALLWLQGEAGIGKSRFLEHVQAEVATDDNVVLYIRLYPDSATSIVQTFSAAIEADPALRRLLTGYNFKTILGLQSGLRRIIRTRPTLLIIDDIHLLSEESSYELASLFDGLRDEPIAAICASRPGATSVYETIYPYKIKTIELPALRMDDIQRLLSICYSEGKAADPALLRKVYETTHGIPLVLRAAMANCLAGSPKLMLSELAPLSRIGFHTKARLAIEALVACLTSQLTTEELQSTKTLALLGEIFCRKAGEKILGGRSELIDQLIEQNVLTSPLVKPELLFEAENGLGNAPLTFVHSLLYDQLAETGIPEWEELLTTLESTHSLYSIAPLLRLANVPQQWSERALRILIRMIEELAHSQNRELATPVFNVAAALYQTNLESIDEEVKLDIRLHLLRLRLYVISFVPSHKDFASTLEEFLDLTEDPESSAMALHRLAALAYSTHLRSRWWELTLNDVLDEAELLIEKFPALSGHQRHIKLLGSVATALRSVPAPSILERVHHALEGLLSHEEEGIRRAALHWVAAPLLMIFNLPEELQSRKKLARLVQENFGQVPQFGNFYTLWPQYLESTGNILEAYTILRERTQSQLKGYDIAEELALRLLILSSKAALGYDLISIERDAHALLQEYLEIDDKTVNNSRFALVYSALTGSILLIGILRHAHKWSKDVAVSLGNGNEEEYKRYFRFEIAATTQNREELSRLSDTNVVPAQYRSLVSCVVDSPGKTVEDRAVEEARQLLSEPVFRRQDILRLLVTTSLVQTAIESGRLGRRSLKIEIRNALKRGLEWSAEHHLPGYLEPLLRLSSDFLGQEDLNLWEDRLTAVEKSVAFALDKAESPPEDNRPQLCMIGTIQIKKPGGESRRISGARARHVLGLLTANELNNSSMPPEEFRKLATGLESGQEAANYLRIMISRLRRLLGEDAIINDAAESPRLNLASIRVDLIEVNQLIANAQSAARERDTEHAYKALLNVLRIVEHNVILPALFDDVFENVRREVEIRLRKALFATLTLLDSSKDTQRMLTLLEMAEKAIPQDEEIAEQLTTTLHNLGRHVEALSLENRSQELFDT